MITLFINTATNITNLVLLENYSIIAEIKEENDRNLSDKLALLIKELYEKANKKITDTNKVLVIKGPGSFTGIRLGVTEAKVIAWSLKIPINSISTLELLSTTKTDKEYLVPVINDTKGYAYSAVYNSNLETIHKDSYIKLEYLNNFLLDLDNYEIISDDDIENARSSVSDIIKLVKKYENVPSENPHNVNPHYIKKTEAEMKLEND